MANPAEVGPPVASIAEAVGRMGAIDTSLPARDGVACFNRLYMTVTRTVAIWLSEGRFEDAEFLDRLDLVFANRYLDALRAGASGVRRGVPRSWRALFDARRVDAVTSIQFAAAGINAHINFDLALALVQTCTELGVALGSGSQHADYQKVNDIFAGLYRTMRQDFLEGRIEELDVGHAARVADAGSHFAVESARDAAWRNAELIADLQDVPFLGDDLVRRFVDGLDRTFGFAGQGLLVRVR